MIHQSQVLEAATRLQPLPESASRLASIVGQPEPDIGEIVHVISFDQVTTMKMLRAANSAASGSAREISTVKDAVVRLGTGSVLCLAIGSCVKSEAGHAVPEYKLHEQEFWRHSVATALAAERMRKCCSCLIPPESFTAGLLHDFGKLVLRSFLDEEKLSLLKRARVDGGLNYAQAEMELFGISHADVGGAVAQHWQLPESIVQPIIYHHTPHQMPTQACYVVHLANEIAKAAIGHQDAADLTVDSDAWEQLGMTPSNFALLSEEVAQDIDQVLALYN